VAAGIEVATGELLRTMETVAGERLRYSASILRVAGLSASGRFFFAVIVLREDGCVTYGNSCTPLAGTAHGGEIQLRKFSGCRPIESYKI
jgi:hypothetical protein